MELAMIQLAVSGDKKTDVRRACEKLSQVKEEGAQIAVLPEMFCCPYSNQYFREYAEDCNGFIQSSLRETASRLGIIVVGGSFPELDGNNIYNTSCVYDETGNILAKHRKMHLFDINIIGGQRFFESETFNAGNEITTFETVYGRLGLCICFDFRFEELARIMTLDGAKTIIVPAAFNMTTGPAHWELLFRQRAVDNQVFTVGVAPARDDNGVYVSYGNSIVASPWGDVVARCDEKECIQIVSLNFDKIESVRNQLPILSARRKDIYSILPNQR